VTSSTVCTAQDFRYVKGLENAFDVYSLIDSLVKMGRLAPVKVESMKSMSSRARAASRAAVAGLQHFDSSKTEIGDMR